MDQDSNQPQPNSGSQNPSGQPMYSHPNVYQPPVDASQYPQYGPMGGLQYPPYGPPMGGPQYPQYGPMGGPQYPPYPYPGYAPEQPPKKSSKAWLWVLLGVIGVALVACIISSIFFVAAFVPAISSSVSATATAASTQDNSGNNVIHSADIHIVPLGQAVTVQNVVCTVTLQKYTTGDSTAAPKPGDEFAVLHIKLVNHSNQTQQYDPADFYVTNATGQATLNSTLVPKAYAKQLKAGSIAPGQSIEGDLVFEIVSKAHGQALDWEPNFNMSPDNSILGQWTLGS